MGDGLGLDVGMMMEYGLAMAMSSAISGRGEVSRPGVDAVSPSHNAWMMDMSLSLCISAHALRSSLLRYQYTGGLIFRPLPLIRMRGSAGLQPGGWYGILLVGSLSLEACGAAPPDPAYL